MQPTRCRARLMPALGSHGAKMKPEFADGHVRADCPDCGAPTTFEFMHGGGEFGSVLINKPVQHEGRQYTRLIYKLLRCSVCQRAAVAKVALTVRG
jgi:hypothetical protein